MRVCVCVCVSLAPVRFTEFIFESRWAGTVVTLVLTPLSGDPDMYVSTSPNANGTNSFWRAATMGVDVIQIFPTDPHACAPPCRYYIGITGYGGTALFTITGSTSSSAPSLLLNGRPQSAFVNQSFENLYYFDAAANVPSFTIHVVATYGDPDIYVRLDGAMPTVNYYQFVSLAYDQDSSLTISTSDPLFRNCTANTNGGNYCRVFIGIYGYSESAYTITAALSDATTLLQEGVPMSAAVNGSVYNYYKFTATAAIAYTFTLTPVSGDPDMYISITNSTPSIANNTWFSNGLGLEVININILQNPLVRGTFACVFVRVRVRCYRWFV